MLILSELNGHAHSVQFKLLDQMLVQIKFSIGNDEKLNICMLTTHNFSQIWPTTYCNPFFQCSRDRKCSTQLPKMQCSYISLSYGRDSSMRWVQGVDGGISRKDEALGADLFQQSVQMTSWESCMDWRIKALLHCFFYEARVDHYWEHCQQVIKGNCG